MNQQDFTLGNTQHKKGNVIFNKYSSFTPQTKWKENVHKIIDMKSHLKKDTLQTTTFYSNDVPSDFASLQSTDFCWQAQWSWTILQNHRGCAESSIALRLCRKPSDTERIFDAKNLLGGVEIPLGLPLWYYIYIVIYIYINIYM